MEQSPYEKLVGAQLVKEILHILWNLKVCHHIHKRLPEAS